MAKYRNGEAIIFGEVKVCPVCGIKMRKERRGERPFIHFVWVCDGCKREFPARP